LNHGTSCGPKCNPPTRGTREVELNPRSVGKNKKGGKGGKDKRSEDFRHTLKGLNVAAGDPGHKRSAGFQEGRQHNCDQKL